MNVRYRVELSQTERTELTELLSGGKHAARRLKRAQIVCWRRMAAPSDLIATNVRRGKFDPSDRLAADWLPQAIEHECLAQCSRR